MELKPFRNVRGSYYTYKLLIVPYGIETGVTLQEAFEARHF